MDARLTKTQRVLHLVQPRGDGFSGSSLEPGRNVAFTSRIMDDSITRSLDESEPMLIQFPWSLWSEFGRPDEVTVTIREGDTLND